MAMGGVVLPDVPGWLIAIAGAELPQAIMVYPNIVIVPVDISPCPETERDETGPEVNQVTARCTIPTRRKRTTDYR
jgi:hypothetical protein